MNTAVFVINWMLFRWDLFQLNTAVFVINWVLVRWDLFQLNTAVFVINWMLFRLTAILKEAATGLDGQNRGIALPVMYISY